jgi:hypothetical protein
LNVWLHTSLLIYTLPFPIMNWLLFCVQFQRRSLETRECPCWHGFHKSSWPLPRSTSRSGQTRLVTVTRGHQLSNDGVSCITRDHVPVHALFESLWKACVHLNFLFHFLTFWYYICMIPSYFDANYYYYFFYFWFKLLLGPFCIDLKHTSLWKFIANCLLKYVYLWNPHTCILVFYVIQRASVSSWMRLICISILYSSVW